MRLQELATRGASTGYACVRYRRTRTGLLRISLHAVILRTISLRTISLRAVILCTISLRAILHAPRQAQYGPSGVRAAYRSTMSQYCVFQHCSAPWWQRHTVAS
eukprot:3435600-Rhodomonas_salina.9